MSEPRVEVAGLWEGYRLRAHRGKREIGWALKGVTLHINGGEMLGIVGPNGSGKTTLLQSIAGVLPPSKGTVVRSGRVASLVNLDAGVHRDLTGHENVLIGGVLFGLSRATIRARYNDIVAFAELDSEALESPLRTYSAGMALRLAFSIVVHADASILVVDEVLAVGDEHFQQRCITRVHEMQEQGCAVALVSHDLDLVREHCSRAIVLDSGTIAFEGAAEDAVDYYRARR